MELSTEIITEFEKPVKFLFAAETVDSRDRFLYHKTTQRTLYKQELHRARMNGCFDAIFRNERNEITEGAISNVFIKKADVYYTPPVSCGLLAGTFRKYLMEDERVKCEERILFEEDLRTADMIYLTNSVRGMIEATLYEP